MGLPPLISPPRSPTRGGGGGGGASPVSVTAPLLAPAPSAPLSPSSRQRLKTPLPAFLTLPPVPAVPAAAPPSWATALARASAALQALVATPEDGGAASWLLPPSGVRDNTPAPMGGSGRRGPPLR